MGQRSFVNLKVPLSVVILTKNEAHRLGDCLKSVEWADECLVIDDESTDSTVQLAESMGARVLHRKMDIEGRHRNWSYAQARNEWVLSLDADERVTPELSREIQCLLDDGSAFDIYSIPRRNYIGNHWLQHGGWYPSAQVKLFKRTAFRWEETTVHPRAISHSAWGTLRADIIHFSYRDIADFVSKLNRQTTLETEKWILDGRRMPFRKALWRSVDRFYRSYWGKKGHRDGFLGYAVAVFAGMYQFLSFAKYWHRKTEIDRGNRESKRSLPEPVSQERQFALSVVILTKDAAATVQGCLSSVQWVEELIVIDGGSVDGTVEICRAAGAKVIRLDVHDDFGQMRNEGTRLAKGDWVLQLDADEVVTPDFRKALELICSQPSHHAAYKFRRRNNFLGHWMRFGGWDHHSLHLFKRGFAHYEGRVHERLLVQGSVGVLEVGVEHYPFRSLEEFVDRQNRYTTLEARQLVESRGPVFLKTIRFQTSVKPIKLFWKIFIKKQGFREGMIGFIFAGLYAFVHFLKWAKVWEIQYGNSS